MAKAKKVKEVGNGFNLDDWISVKNPGTHGYLGENQIQIKVQRYDKNPKKYALVIAFRKSIVDFLAPRKDEGIFILQNKDDESRFIMIRSPNGYKICVPTTGKNYYFIKFSVFLSKQTEKLNKLLILFFMINP
jgi:hypothetical protein